MTDPTRRPNPNAGKAPAPRPAAAQPARPAAQPQAARPAAAQQQRRPAAAPAPAPAPARRPIRRAEDAQEALDPTTKRGLIAAGVLVIIGAAVWIVIGNKKRAEHDAEVAYQNMVNGFADAVNAVVKEEPPDPAHMQAKIDEIDREKDKWKDKFRENDVSRGRSILVGKLDDAKRRKEFLEQFAKVEEIVKNIASKSSDDIRGARQV